MNRRRCSPRAGPGGSAHNLLADEELAKYAKALGHPARVRILRILARHTECICGEMVLRAAKKGATFAAPGGQLSGYAVGRGMQRGLRSTARG